jgi:hypothetical protein
VSAGLAAEDSRLRLTTTVTGRPGEDSPDEFARADSTQVDSVRAALGLPPLPPSAAADDILERTPPSAPVQLVSRLLARRARAAGLAGTPDLAITAAAFAGGRNLPLSAGAFGGTTIVVLPDDATDEDVAAWLALEEPDVVQRHTRFHSLRIAHGDSDRSPRAVIEKLRAENPQRRDFLLVPAVFCSDESELESMRAGLGELATEIHLEMRHGLGAELPVGGE